ncbi:hypothetical protein [Paracoccus rhizosphaerae]|uniref:Uncharacterized protein n=2 Tax=Paracoccus rhizosphaerae TaxID=1133347 RepID=A0ABV6CH29_9RHOB
MNIFFRTPVPLPAKDEEFVHDLPSHRLQYRPGGSTLIVSFDNAARVDKEAYVDRKSWGESFYLREKHSLLGVIARETDWYRNRKLIRTLEEWAKCGFFRSFDRVVLTGGSMGGFAAMTFASLVPGCIVIAFSPQSTLDPKIALSDNRFPSSRRYSWRLPYSDAAANVAAAGKAYIIYDNLLHLDRWHVARLPDAEHIYKLPIPGCGHGGTPVINQIGFFKEITRGMISGKMEAGRFRRLVRMRRRSSLYYFTLVDHAEYRGHLSFLPCIRKLASLNLPEIELQELDDRLSLAIKRLSSLKKSPQSRGRGLVSETSNPS